MAISKVRQTHDNEYFDHVVRAQMSIHATKDSKERPDYITFLSYQQPSYNPEWWWLETQSQSVRVIYLGDFV